MGSVYSLNTIKNNCVPIAREYGITKLYVFGSYAREEQTEESDIDILIEKGDIKNLLQYFGFVSELENVFNVHVDVVTTTSNDKSFLDRIKKEAILIYDSEGQNNFTENKAVL